MKRSIGRQILIPIVAIQTLTVLGVALTTAALAASRTERQMIERINGVASTIETASFPLTAPVLARIRELSGADLVVLDQAGRVLTSTIPTLRTMSALAGETQLQNRVESLANVPRLALPEGLFVAVQPLPARHGSGTTLVLFSEAAWIQARWEAAVSPMLLGALSLALMSAATYWVSEKIRRRMLEMRRQVALIAEGNFVDLNCSREDDEVNDLAESIQVMSRQLRLMKQSIEQGERTRLLAQVAAGLAHQLRNSISGARMSIQLHARRTPVKDGDRSLEVALKQLTITEGQIRGLLSLGKVEKSAHTPCDLNELLDVVALLVEPTARHAGVQLDTEREIIDIRVCVDKSGLQAAILNLAINAIEAAGQGGQVRLRLLRRDQTAMIEVWDSGRGPSPELSATLFDVFVTSKAEGVGLGLALAHQVAAEHAGELTWNRRDDGTVFCLTLPISSHADTFAR